VSANHPLVLWAIVSVLMIVSGLLDSLAFAHSAGIWRDGRIVWLETAKAGAAFSCGIAVYWAALRYLAAFGVALPEIQTLIWFSATIVGVTILGGRFAQLPAIDQFVAINGLASLGWLIVRTSA
jgi:hypothetical protein